ncbi:titin [Salarias fasciatus]|uniref:titin n=1 Tax=Salarias fasciatus TaxID=181472 RepID=UPI001176C5F5|nr:titin-like [Salarias fasciatus]
MYEEEGHRGSLRTQYEKSLEAERMECEEKLLALRIRKWQQGMRMSEEEAFHPEIDLPMPAEVQYTEPKERDHGQQEVMEKPVEHSTTHMSRSPKVSSRSKEEHSPVTSMKARPQEMEIGASVSSSQKSPRMKTKIAEEHFELSKSKASPERMLFEMEKGERELQLSMENLTELKNESEKFVSEEEALTQRIMKWQQDVLMEQDKPVKLESDWVEGYQKTTEVTEDGAESFPHPEVVRKGRDSLEKTAKEKFMMSEVVPSGFQGQEAVRTQWLPVGELPTEQPVEGHETRLQRDSEYFVSEEEALAQRILKWQQDAVEQDEVTELESDWTLDSHYKPPGSVIPSESELQLGGTPLQTHSGEPPQLAAPTKGASPVQQVAVHSPPSPVGSSSITRHLEHHVVIPVPAVKDQMPRQASPDQRHSPTKPASGTYKGFELPPSRDENIQPSREFSSVRRSSPSCSPEKDSGKEVERRLSREEFPVMSYESDNTRFQSEVRKEREMGTLRESSGQRPQKGFVGPEEKDFVGSKLVGEMSSERTVKERSNITERVYESPETKLMKKEESAIGGSRPVFVKETSSIKVKIGQMSEFTCQFQGEPLPVVTWLKDGHPLAHNPDYDIVSKANSSKLTVFYPTTDHQGSYDCVISNKHGKSICSATLQVSDKKVLIPSGGERKVLVTEEQDSQESQLNEELQTYMDSAKTTLQVPQAVIHKRRSSEEPFSSSPVEIRITAATPIPEMMEEMSEETLQPHSSETSDVPLDEAASQTIKHKFTFSFDVVGEAPCVVAGLESAPCFEGDTAMLECIITGEPAPEVTWFFDNVSIEVTEGKYRMEVDEKVYRLYVGGFTDTDAGVYKCVARNNLGEVTSSSEVSLQVKKGTGVGYGFSPPGALRQSPEKPTESHKLATTHVEAVRTEDESLISQSLSDRPVKAPRSRVGPPKEAPAISGCGLPSSAAIINVSQMKQAFESDPSVAVMTPPSLPELRKETQFPEEFIPAVAISLQQQEQVTEAEATHDKHSDQLPALTANPGTPNAPRSPPEAPETSYPPAFGEGAHVSEDHEMKQFVEEVQESAGLVRPKPLKPLQPSEPVVHEPEIVKDRREHTYDRTSSFIRFEPEKVPGVKVSAPTEGAVKPKRHLESAKAERGSPSEGSVSVHIHSKASITEEPVDTHSPRVVLGSKEGQECEIKGLMEECDFIPDIPKVGDEENISGEELISIPELSMDKGKQVELISIPEPSMDSGVFVSMSESQNDVTEKLVGEIKDEDDGTDVQLQPLTFIPKIDASNKMLGESEDVVFQEESLSASIAESDGATGAARAAGAAASSMEEEEVTFGAVYDYYNPPADWGRPLSPESEMSIEIGSTVSEEVADVAERFYTPGSSTEASQPIAESLHSPKSPLSFHTPSSDTLGGFRTPQEYPFSSVEHQRASTGDSSDMFFSPVQFLASPADESFEPADISVDENRFLTRGGLGTVQEKVQGIPPAFLKPLIKKRVFENESLTFFAEVFGLPSPKVKWFCNKTQLLANHRTIMERDGDSISLTIHNITKADQGEYICEAVNYVGEARSVALVVVVSQEVKFLPAPPAVTHQHVMEFDVEEDDSSRSPSPQEILLEVELDENEVKEFEKQVKIITIPEYTADNKSMIISLDVLPSIYEEGTVDFVTQEHDDLKIAFEVTEMPPRFINPICDMETPEGTTVMFECSLMGIPSPIVSWFKSDKKIPHNNKKYLHSSDGDNHFLKIGRVTPQDSGVYTCRAINVVGETLCRASLVVLSTQAFSGKTRGRELTAVSLGSAKLQPQKFDLMVGNTSFDGDQVSEIELEFEFEQEADESQRAVRLVANTDNELSEQGEKYVSINFDVFAEPAKDDKVEFKGKSSEMCSFQFQVTETPPKCIIPLTNVTAALGTPVILQCLVNGKPNPTAEWYKDGERVTDSRCIIQEKTAGHFNLLITNVTQSDAGEYKCVIHNSAGGVETSALLKVF